MIEYIKGILTELSPTNAVVEAAGVGYDIAITLPTYSALIGREASGERREESGEWREASGERREAVSNQPSEPVKLYITEVIREDTHELYGFVVKAERQLFELLMTVSGVGAATARMIMSAFSAEELRMLIATGNSKGMAKVKGLGPKTAQRIIVDLKDKALKMEPSDVSIQPSELFEVEESPVKTEAISALTMLGFPANNSGKVVDKILKADPTMKVESVIRQALKML